MLYLWHNNKFCLKPENDEEFECLKALYYAFKKGIRIDPDHDPDNSVGYSGSKYGGEDQDEDQSKV